MKFRVATRIFAARPINRYFGQRVIAFYMPRKHSRKYYPTFNRWKRNGTKCVWVEGNYKIHGVPDRNATRVSFAWCIVQHSQTLSAFKMPDASIVIPDAYNATRDVRHDWHLLRHLASCSIVPIPSCSYTNILPIDIILTPDTPEYAVAHRPRYILPIRAILCPDTPLRSISVTSSRFERYLVPILWNPPLRFIPVTA